VGREHVAKKLDLEAMIDDMIQPAPGHDRVYMVPRLSGCMSAKFLDMMNYFGHKGGFLMILECIENQKLDEHLNLTILAYYNTMISMAVSLWHRDWMNEFGQKYIDAMVKRLLESNDKFMRDMDKDAHQQALSSINFLMGRLLTPTEASK
jgi:hypothetical protein